jgi:hypothetical protein
LNDIPFRTITPQVFQHFTKKLHFKWAHTFYKKTKKIGGPVTCTSKHFWFPIKKTSYYLKRIEMNTSTSSIRLNSKQEEENFRLKNIIPRISIKLLIFKTNCMHLRVHTVGFKKEQPNLRVCKSSSS